MNKPSTYGNVAFFHGHNPYLTSLGKGCEPNLVRFLPYYSLEEVSFHPSFFLSFFSRRHPVIHPAQLEAAIKAPCCAAQQTLSHDAQARGGASPHCALQGTSSAVFSDRECGAKFLDLRICCQESLICAYCHTAVT